MGLLKWALIFAIVSGIAAVFGFTGISADAAGVARVLFGLFLAVAVIIFLLGVTVFRKV